MALSLSTQLQRHSSKVGFTNCQLGLNGMLSQLLKIWSTDLLACSPFLEDVDHILECFDRLTKPRFRNTEDPQFIKFGSARDNDLERGIKFGQLKLLGLVFSFAPFSTWIILLYFWKFRSDVAMFFEPSVQCIIDSVLSQQRSSQKHTISVDTLTHTAFSSELMISRSACCPRGWVCSQWLPIWESRCDS